MSDHGGLRPQGRVGRRHRQDRLPDNGSIALTERPQRNPEAKAHRRRPSFWHELPLLIIASLLLTFLTATFVVRPYEIPSGSMEKTLHGCTGCINDRVLVDKLSYRFGAPSPGDVIVFAGPPSWTETDAGSLDNPLAKDLPAVSSLIGLGSSGKENFIKRVIAVGGQTVACCTARNQITVDGKPLNEPYLYYLPAAGAPYQKKFGPVFVPPGQLWVMGDSRNNSEDSTAPEHFGPIPVGDVIGKARFVVWPIQRVKVIPDADPQ